METGLARSFYEKYASAIAYVAVEQSNGAQSIGSALHVGDGVFVTARHVVEGVDVAAVGIPYPGASWSRVQEDGESTMHDVPRVQPIDNRNLQVVDGPYFHSDDRVDVAVFRVDDIDPRTPVIQLGGHLDEWIDEDSFVLSEAVIFGYPPIPMTTTPVLMGARAEINAVVDRYDSPHVHFILSAMPRGGFSGGVAMSEGDFALGVVTQSLLADSAAPELGYMSVIGVEPVHQCLVEHRFLPECQEFTWLGIWTRRTLEFSRWVHGTIDPVRNPESGLVEYIDDGKRLSVKVSCDNDPSVLEQALSSVRGELAGYPTEEKTRKKGERLIEIDHSGVRSIETARRAAYMAAQEFLIRGFKITNPSALREIVQQ